MSLNDRVGKRVRLRRGRRPARAVDQIKADDGPEFALLKRALTNVTRGNERL
jgi:hypothetical protein